MKPTIDFEPQRFNAVMREWLAGSSREFTVAMNSRMSFFLMRAFILVPPLRAQEKRDKIKSYLNRPIGAKRIKAGKPAKKANQLQLVHLIINSSGRRDNDPGRRGLYGEQMRQAAAAMRRMAIGSVGYLKSGIATAIKRFNGHFTQFGTSIQEAKSSKFKGKKISANGAFTQLMQQYAPGEGVGNIAKHKGAKVKTMPATFAVGLKSNAAMVLSLKIKDGEQSRVSAIYSQAFMVALRDERVEMERVIAERLEATAQKAIDHARR